MNIKVDNLFNRRIQKAFIYDPKSNNRNCIIYDPLNRCAIGFLDSDTPYYPVGGSNAVEEIVKGKGEFQGLVIGANVLGYQCFHCHDDVYRLTNFNGR